MKGTAWHGVLLAGALTTLIVLAIAGCGDSGSDSSTLGPSDSSASESTASSASDATGGGADASDQAAVESCLKGVGETYAANNFPDKSNYDISVFGKAGDIAIVYGTDSPASAADLIKTVSVTEDKYPERDVSGSFAYFIGADATPADKSAVLECVS